jgi:4a-hydroxytetrahydrobiopterin dehydratase
VPKAVSHHTVLGPKNHDNGHMSARALIPAALDEFLANLAGWSLENGQLTRHFGFASYSAGVAFAIQVVLLAEKHDHHPDALTIGWKKVQVSYVTHSAGGITLLDIEAAQQLNALFD